MQLIIKPTGRCNFNCTFCSAHDMRNDCHPADGKVPKVLKEFIKKLKPRDLIITGGDPLMVPPEYYYELHELGDYHIAPTTNLKDFYLHPDKWTPLFKESWFDVTTSFNYGTSRMWDANTIFTEDLFIKVLDRFREYTGKPNPAFIAVIDEDNESRVMDHVYLAKRLDTMVKINGAVRCGRQAMPYPQYKIFQYYIDIIDAGLGGYEINCVNRGISRCPKCIDVLCTSTIRCCYVDNNQKLHVGICDEQLSLGYELTEDEIFYEKSDMSPDTINHNDLICPECEFCEMFYLCNGCSVHRRESKQIPSHCEEMKKLLPRLIEQGWLM